SQKPGNRDAEWFRDSRRREKCGYAFPSVAAGPKSRERLVHAQRPAANRKNDSVRPETAERSRDICPLRHTAESGTGSRPASSSGSLVRRRGERSTRGSRSQKTAPATEVAYYRVLLRGELCRVEAFPPRPVRRGCPRPVRRLRPS